MRVPGTTPLISAYAAVSFWLASFVERDTRSERLDGNAAARSEQHDEHTRRRREAITPAPLGPRGS